MLDTEPGYGRKIKAALNEAAEKSHKELDWLNKQQWQHNHGLQLQIIFFVLQNEELWRGIGKKIKYILSMYTYFVHLKNV